METETTTTASAAMPTPRPENTFFAEDMGRFRPGIATGDDQRANHRPMHCYFTVSTVCERLEENTQYSYVGRPT